MIDGKKREEGSIYIFSFFLDGSKLYILANGFDLYDHLYLFQGHLYLHTNGTKFSIHIKWVGPLKFLRYPYKALAGAFR